jgi:hypothetical protein
MRVSKIYKSIIIIPISIIFFPILSWILLFMSLFLAATLYQGSAGEILQPTDILFIIANWPSFLLKIYPTYITSYGKVAIDLERGIFNSSVIIYNSIGWALIGFVVGLIVWITKRKKHINI